VSELVGPHTRQTDFAVYCTHYSKKYHIKFRPIARISFGFIVASMSMLYAGVLQHFIYQAGPCCGHPHMCPAAINANGVAQGNNIHISEIFASVTGLEYVYMKAPPSMKSFVQATYLLTNAFGYALGEAFIPLVSDPHFMWLFAGLCVGSFTVGCIFWILFHRFDGKDETNSLDAKHDDLDNKRVLNETGNDVTGDTH
jgi:POT family proton-dependent oligopeptide transporter